MRAAIAQRPAAPATTEPPRSAREPREVSPRGAVALAVTIREASRARQAPVIVTGVTQFDLATEALNARRWRRGTQLQIVPFTFSRRQTLLSRRVA